MRTSRRHAAKTMRLAKIKARLRAARSSAGISKEQLATRLGITSRTVYEWEKGEKSLPNAYFLAKMALVYDVTSDFLLGLTDREDGLRVGHAIFDAENFDLIKQATNRDEAVQLLNQQGTVLWTEIPNGAEVIPVDEAKQKLQQLREQWELRSAESGHGQAGAAES